NENEGEEQDREGDQRRHQRIERRGLLIVAVKDAAAQLLLNFDLGHRIPRRPGSVSRHKCTDLAALSFFDTPQSAPSNSMGPPMLSTPTPPDCDRSHRIAETPWDFNPISSSSRW